MDKKEFVFSKYNEMIRVKNRNFIHYNVETAIVNNSFIFAKSYVNIPEDVIG